MLQELNADHAPPPQEPNRTNVTTLQETPVTTNEVTGDVSLQRTHGTPNDHMDQQEGRRTSVARSKKNREEEKPTGEEDRPERLARALQLAAEDEIAVVTVRVSGKLNDYMDRYVERINRIQPKRRYRKQDAVAEAFAAFFADHPMPPAPVDNEL